MALGIGSVQLDLDLNQKKFDSKLNGLTKTARRVGKAIAAALSIKAVTSFAASCIELGSDLTEVQNVVDVTFPHMTEAIDKFAKNAAQQFGLSETMAKRYAGTFGSMAEAFGFTEEQAAAMGTTLTGLAGDVASFYNITQDEAYTKLKSVFTGETESLKELGIVMTKTSLDQYALANGFGKTTAAMSEAEKVALRYSFVQSQLSNATGDFARTASTSWANQVRILTLQFQSLKATIGQGLIKAFLPVIKVINTLLGRVLTLANALSSLFGGGGSGNGGGGGGMSISGGNKTFAGSAQAASESFSDSAKSSGTMASNAAKAAKSADKLKKDLAGFDKITKLSDMSSTSGGSGGDGTGGGSGADDLGDIGGGVAGMDLGSVSLNSDDLSTASDRSNVLKQWLEKLKPSVEKLKKSFSRFAGVIKDGLAWCWENVLKPLGKWTIEKALPAMINLLAARFNFFASVLEALAPLGQWLWDKFLKPLAKFTGKVFIGFLNKSTAALNKLSGWIDEHQEAVQNIAIAIGSFFTAFAAVKVVTKAVKAFQNVSKAISAVKLAFAAVTSPMGLAVIAIGAAITAGVLLYKNWDKVKEVASKVGKKIKETAKQVSTFLKKVASAVWNKIKSTANSVWKKIKTVADDTWKKIKTVAGNVWNKIKTVASDSWNKVKEVAGNIWDSIKGAADDVKAKIETVAGNAWDAIKGAAEDAKAKVEEVAGNIWDSVKQCADDAWGKVEEITGNIWDAIKGAADDAWGKIKDVAGWIIEKIEAIQETFETLKKGIEDGVKAIKGKFDDFKKKVDEVVQGIMDKVKPVLEFLGLIEEDNEANLTVNVKGAETVEGVAEDWGSVNNKSSKLSATATGKDGVVELSKGWGTVNNKSAKLTATAENKDEKTLNFFQNAWSNVFSKTSKLTATAENKDEKVLTTIQGGWGKIDSKNPKLTATAENKNEKELKTLGGQWGSISKKDPKLTATTTNKNADVLKDLSGQWGKVKTKDSKLTAQTVNQDKKVLDTVAAKWKAIPKKKQAKLTAVTNSKNHTKLLEASKSWGKINTKDAKLNASAKNNNKDTLNTLSTKWGKVYTKSATLTSNIKTNEGGKSLLDKIKDMIKDFKNKSRTLTTIVKYVYKTEGTKPKSSGAVNPYANESYPIRKLATGGYVKANTPQLAMIGDNRHQGEVVAPEDKLAAMAREAAASAAGAGNAEMIALLRQLIGVVQAKDTSTYLDGKAITKTVVANVNRSTRATGTCAIIT